MADDPDSGESFMRKHMSEGQPSKAAGGFGDRRKNRYAAGTDSYMSQRYGKGGDEDMAEQPQSVNSGAKGNKY